MRRKILWLLAAAVASLGSLAFAADAPAPSAPVETTVEPTAATVVKLPQAAADAVKAAFPNTVIAPKVTMIEIKGATFYDAITVEGTAKTGRKLTYVRVSESGVIITARKPVAPANLPEIVSDTVKRVMGDVTIMTAARIETRAGTDLKPVAPPTISYNMNLRKDDLRGSIVVAEDGSVIRTKAMAMPPPAPKPAP